MELAIVVPFLLGLSTTSIPKTRFGLEYTYEVMINTSSIQFLYLNKIFSSSTTNIANLILDLKCYTKLEDRIVCRVGNLKNLNPVPEVVPLYTDFWMDTNLLVTPEDLDKDNLPFEIRFDTNGIVSYAVNKNDEMSIKMMNVYRWITSPLSVGINVYSEKRSDTFYPLEQNFIGYCTADYNFKQHPMNVSGDFHLISLSDLPFSLADEVIITKQRTENDCIIISDYVFSMRFWPELIPKHADSYKMIHSYNVMTLSGRGFESAMVNTISFYQKTPEETVQIGVIKESLNLKLKSYRIIYATDKYWVDNRNAVKMEVSPDSNY